MGVFEFFLGFPSMIAENWGLVKLAAFGVMVVVILFFLVLDLF